MKIQNPKTSAKFRQIWRPAQIIKVKVLALIWRGSSFLACRVYDDSGELKGVRPPGGTVNFGETTEIALAREIKEELALTAKKINGWLTFENIYVHEKMTGHEVVFIANVELLEKDALKKPYFIIKEKSGIQAKAEWFDLKTLEANNIRLLPEQLFSHLSK